MHRRRSPFFFLAKTMLDDQGLLDFLITFVSKSCWRCCFSSSYIAGGIRLCFCLNGVLSWRVILCLTRLVKPKSSSVRENTDLCDIINSSSCFFWSSLTAAPVISNIDRKLAGFGWSLRWLDWVIPVDGNTELVHHCSCETIAFDGIIMGELVWFDNNNAQCHLSLHCSLQGMELLLHHQEVYSYLYVALQQC